ncbi:MAG: M64 family metallo-endopeptidase [Proteobacteria bacterium]|nr:M64 family metallo-endopeptidase [Pseudomonadota bacterium]
MNILWSILCLSFISQPLAANPYWDPTKAPQMPPSEGRSREQLTLIDHKTAQQAGVEVLRIQIDWQSGEIYTLGEVRRELSGTSTLLRRAKTKNPLGSYQGVLFERDTGKILAYDAIGTGREYRKLTRALTFRFPLYNVALTLSVLAENPTTGEMQEVLRTDIELPTELDEAQPANIEMRQIYANPSPNSLKVVFYADGYLESQRAAFFNDADRAYRALRDNRWPSIETMDFKAVFVPSATTLGNAQNLRLPVPERNSYLGLYHPYWDNFGRWKDVVYPTRESKYRSGIAVVPYDYPIVLVDSSTYWGVGNFNELTAIPSRNTSFSYLLLHEFGHYFGLNEEYGGGGRTELEFAEQIREPWSQNITFAANLRPLKWANFTAPSTPIPTPPSQWNDQLNGPIGAYPGGYAESQSTSASHKPGLSCTMNRSPKFCSVCSDAIKQKISFDQG